MKNMKGTNLHFHFHVSWQIRIILTALPIIMIMIIKPAKGLDFIFGMGGWVVIFKISGNFPDPFPGVKYIRTPSSNGWKFNPTPCPIVSSFFFRKNLHPKGGVSDKRDGTRWGRSEKKETIWVYEKISACGRGVRKYLTLVRGSTKISILKVSTHPPLADDKCQVPKCLGPVTFS